MDIPSSLVLPEPLSFPKFAPGGAYPDATSFKPFLTRAFREVLRRELKNTTFQPMGLHCRTLHAMQGLVPDGFVIPAALNHALHCWKSLAVLVARRFLPAGWQAHGNWGVLGTVLSFFGCVCMSLLLTSGHSGTHPSPQQCL